MTPDITRRALMHGLLAGAALPVLGGCGAVARGVSPGAGARGGKAALLLPLTGAMAAVGQNMARAAELVTQGAGGTLSVEDTGDTAEGAAVAAKRALETGATLLFGPLKADQTPAVLAVAKRVPVISFSNDDTLATQGAFVMGITPAQSVSTLLSYARSQGIARIAVLARDGPLGQATVAAARSIGAAGGITVSAALLRDPAEPGLIAALKGDGSPPQAVFLPDGGATLSAFARALRGADVQLMGSVQWGIGDIADDATLSGAWFAAPPPDLFLPFAERFQAAHGMAPGLVAGLGHDAALMAAGLADGNGVSRKGLLRTAGFTGVLGSFRFLKTGLCQRDLSVLTVKDGALSVLAEVTGS